MGLVRFLEGFLRFPLQFPKVSYGFPEGFLKVSERLCIVIYLRGVMASKLS